MIADLYFDYLHTRDARPLLGVFYHNEMDVVSLAALLANIADLLSSPLDGTIQHGLDMIAIGKLYADLGYPDIAVKIYQRGLQFRRSPKRSLLASSQRTFFLTQETDKYQMLPASFGSRLLKMDKSMLTWNLPKFANTIRKIFPLPSTGPKQQSRSFPNPSIRSTNANFCCQLWNIGWND